MTEIEGTDPPVVRRVRRPPPGGPFPVVAAAIAAATLITGTIGAALAAGKGLDLTDEGLSLLTAAFPSEYRRSTVQAHLVWGPILDLVGSVPALRVVKLALMSCGAAAVGLATVRIAPMYDRAARLAVVLSVTAGGLAPWIWLPLSPGYNELATVAALLVVALTIFLLGEPGVHRRPTGRTRLDPTGPTKVAALVAWGGVLWVLALAKWPAAMLLGLGCVVCLADLRRDPWRQLGGIGVMAAGASIAALLTHVLLAPLGEVISGLRTGTRNVSDSHSLSFLVDSYGDDLGSFFGRLLSDRWWALVIAVILGCLLGRPRTRQAGRVGVAVAAMAVVAVAMSTGAATGGHLNLSDASTILPESSSLLLITLGIAAVLDRDLLRDATAGRVRGALLLWSAPLIVSFGTANPLWYNALLLAGCWIAALALTTRVLLGDDPMVIPALCVSAAVLVVSGALTGTWLHPYRQPPLAEADTEVLEGPAAGLEVDAATAAAFEAFAQVTTPDDQPSSAIVLWRQPGIVFASGAVQPLYGWLPRNSPELAASAVEEACERQESIVIAFEDDELPREVRAALGSDPCAERTFEEAGSIRLATGADLAVLVADRR
jgi:hypothetical protein